MAKLTLDTTTVDLDSVFEQIMRKTMNGSKTYQLKEGEPIPSIPSFASDRFTTMTLKTDEGIDIPRANQYNKIVDFTTNYREEDRMYSYSITLGYE